MFFRVASSRRWRRASTVLAAGAFALRAMAGTPRSAASRLPGRPLAGWGPAIPGPRVTELIPQPAWPGDAGRRSPSPDPGAPPASPGMPSAHGGGAPAPRAAPGGSAPDRRSPRPAAGPQAGAGRPAAGTG